MRLTVVQAEIFQPYNVHRLNRVATTDVLSTFSSDGRTLALRPDRRPIHNTLRVS